jgi:hypothetical protein
VDLVEDFGADVDVPLRTAKLGTVHSVTLFFPESFGGDSTQLFYLGFKGVNTGVRHARSLLRPLWDDCCMWHAFFSARDECVCVCVCVNRSAGSESSGGGGV